MNKTSFSTLVLGTLLSVGAPFAHAAPDWAKVPKRDINVFHPGVSPIEWIAKKSDHSGTAGLKKGESCVGCHEEKGTLNFNFKRLADKELEPVGAPKTMIYPVAVQAAYDAALAACAAACGARRETVRRILDLSTAEAAEEIILGEGLGETYDFLAARAAASGGITSACKKRWSHRRVADSSSARGGSWHGSVPRSRTDPSAKLWP